MLPACNNLTDLKVQEDVVNLMSDVKREFLGCIKPIVEQWRGRAKEVSILNS